MALPTNNDILSLEWSFDGSPLCIIPASSSLDLNTLEWSFDGSPLWGINIASVTGKKWNGIIVTKWNGVAISKLNGI